MSDGITFNVETKRILEILACDIYDSPLALLRENLQNAYDAVRMRFAKTGKLETGGRIDIQIDKSQISVTDNGIGMTEIVLRENFWKAGSSGKHTDIARKAGVVGTFGIGAMANFGVCTRLTVETRSEGSNGFLRTIAERDSLKIAEECIDLEHVQTEKDVGTKIIAMLDSKYPISPDQALNYLKPYVSSLPVPVYLNGSLISQKTLESLLPISGRSFVSLGQTDLNDDLFRATFEVCVDSNGQVLVKIKNIQLSGSIIEGNLVLLQSGGQLMGLRSNFGLAPIPAIGYYQFGGYANLSFLHPTAGREALSRDSIDLATRLIVLAERAASELLATTQWADKNNAFLQWIISHSRYDLSEKVSIHVFPEDVDITLGEIKTFIKEKIVHYYTGTDRQILTTFSNEGTCLIQVAQSTPRRTVQKHYITNILHLPQVPDHAQVTKIYDRKSLSFAEASILIRIASILRDDYMIPDVEPLFADISHGVTFLPVKEGELLKIYISKSSSLLPPLLECFNNAYELFTQFMKDFVRVQLYSKIQQYVPSSTKDGVDALRKILQRNRELYRYEETELGDLEGILGDYLKGNVKFTEVLQRTSSSNIRPQTQRVSHEQIGTIEDIVPEIAQSPVKPPEENGIEYEARPPIIKESIISNMKILTTNQKYPLLNNFTMLMSISDRLVRSPEVEFFRTPHTTRIIWGGHRIIYIFTEVTGRLSLYYDIELRNAIKNVASGGGFPTTTLITKNRIFIPIPDALADEFKITTGSKEFFVRFDVLSSDIK
jgi:molecular chaperone HtpG